MKISQKNFILAWENKKLLHGALKAAHVRRDYDRYDDLYQNAVIVYAEMLENNPDKDQKEIDRLSFRKIIWATLNELHKVQINCERTTGMENAWELADERQMEQLVMLKEELLNLRDIERIILIENIAFQHKMTELDQEYDIHRASLQRIKSKLLKRLKDKYQKN